MLILPLSFLSDPTVALWAEVVLLLVLGGLVAKYLGRLVLLIGRVFRRSEYLDLQKEQNLLRVTKYLTWMVVLSVILSLVKPTIAMQVAHSMIAYAPDLLGFLLLLIFGVLVIHLVLVALQGLMAGLGVFDLLSDIREQVTAWVLLLVRLILYVLLLFSILGLYHIQLAFFSYLVFFLIAALITVLLAFLFYGLREPVRNMLHGFLLRYHTKYRKGAKLTLLLPDREVTGTLKEVRSQETVLQMRPGRLITVPNTLVATSLKSYEDPTGDFDSLKSILSHYVEQRPSYCGPAIVSMIFSFLGVEVSQEEIAKLGGTEVGRGTRPDNLITAAGKKSEGRLIGAWVDVEHVADLRRELALWLADDAFVILDFKKSYVFPEARTAHYTLCVAVRDDDLLIVDPNGKTGGVYLVNYRHILRGMDTYSELIGGKRGYLVFGYQGTRAYDRIKAGELYLKPNLYSKVNRRLEEAFHALEDNGHDVMPETIRSFLSRRRKDKVKRVWKP